MSSKETKEILLKKIKKYITKKGGNPFETEMELALNLGKYTILHTSNSSTYKQLMKELEKLLGIKIYLNSNVESIYQKIMSMNKETKWKT